MQSSGDVISTSGDIISSNGDIRTFAGDVYIPNGKAIRIDNTGTTALNIGNWGSDSQGVVVSVLGNLSVNGYGSTAGLGKIFTKELCLNNGAVPATDCRTTWPSGGGTGDLTAVLAGTNVTVTNSGGPTPTVNVSDQWVNTTGDSMTGKLSVNVSSAGNGVEAFTSAIGGYAINGEATGVSGVAVKGTGDYAGGHFADRTDGGSAYIGYGTNSFSGNGTIFNNGPLYILRAAGVAGSPSVAVYTYDTATNGYVTLLGSSLPLPAQGNYYTDAGSYVIGVSSQVYSGGGQDIGVAGAGVYGVYGNGSTIGVVGNGPTGIQGNGSSGPGVQGTGSTYGGSFTGSTYGVYAAGATMGGRFEDSSGTSNANVAYSGYGINASGDTMGGYFADTDGASGRVGYGTYSFYGNGTLYNTGSAQVAGTLTASGLAINGSGSLTGSLDVTNAITAGSVEIDNGSFSARNPSNSLAGVHLGWYNNIARIYVGGSGTGSTGGLEIHRPGSTMQLKVYDNGNLEIRGSTAYKASGTTWTANSDIRLKDVVGPYMHGLEEISKLSPIVYRWKKDVAERKGVDQKTEYIGFSAQAVQEVIPEAVLTGEDGYLLLDADPILWASVNAIKELKAENDALKVQNEKLLKRIEAIEAKLK